MPTYCYRRGEKVVTRVFSVAERPQSIMIGDSDRDVEAGVAAGCKAVKVEQNSNYYLMHKVEKILL